MSLLKPTRGQMLDRLSILDLKIEYCLRTYTDPLRFRLEQEEVLTALAGAPFTGLLEKLKAVNMLIWQANERLSALAHTLDPPPNQAALQMWRWNNERVALIEEIDRESGEYVGPEKVGY